MVPRHVDYISICAIIIISYMVAPVEVGRGGVELLIGNGLLEQHQAGNRHAIGEACLAALEQWTEGHGARSTGQG